VRILLVEDEKKIAGFIERGLKEAHYVVDVAPDGEKGAVLAGINSYDLIILDILLPEKDGVTLCREIRREQADVPILMLTAKSSVKDKVMGLKSGADDYLTKPFDFDELLARIQVLLRRKQTGKPNLLRVADLELDQMAREVKRAGKLINLTSQEYTLLRFLMLHADQVVTRTMISEHVWDKAFDTCTNVVDVYINYLRNKIDKGFSFPLIHTIRSAGYTLKDAV
jgi:DNA-binding response OmpR family regulator